jgi:DNA-binding transcriptional regulator YiaG
VAGAPYVAKLEDGRYFAVELPEGSAQTDAMTGDVVLQPAAIRLLDRLRALLSPLPQKTTANRLRILREVLSLDPDELSRMVQVSPESVLAWEAGKAQPTVEQLSALETLRQQAARSGVLLRPRGLAS